MILHQIALFGLANWTKKVFPVFPRNIPYRARPKGPPFYFFRHCETFFWNKIFPKGSPFNFFCCFASEWMLENPKGSVLSVFRHCETFFPKIFFSPKGPPSISLIFYNRLGVWNPKGSPLSVFRHCEIFFENLFFSPRGPPFNCDKNVDNFGSVPLLARQGLALAGPGAPLGPFF